MNLYNYVTGGQPLEWRLAQLATSRLSHDFAESFKRAYASMFRVFLSFVIFMPSDIHQVTVLQLLCFLEYLQYKRNKAPQMVNYLSAVKTKFIILGLDIACFADTRFKILSKSSAIAFTIASKVKESH